MQMNSPAGMKLEPVHLNRNRSRIILRPEGKAEITFNGLDYFRLHHVICLPT